MIIRQKYAKKLPRIRQHNVGCLNLEFDDYVNKFAGFNLKWLIFEIEVGTSFWHTMAIFEVGRALSVMSNGCVPNFKLLT